MDKKSVIGFVLIFLLFFGYMWWVKPSDEEIAERRHQDSVSYVERMRADSVARAEQAMQQQEDSLYQAAMNDTTLRDSAGAYLNPAMNAKLGCFEPNKRNQPLKVNVHNGVIDVELQSLGASVQEVVLSDFRTFDSLPLQLITPDKNNMDLVLVDAHNDVVNTSRIPFAVFCNDKPLAQSADLTLEEGDSLTLSFRAYVQSAAVDSVETVDVERYLEFRYVFRHGSYEVDYDINFHRINEYISTTPSLTFEWHNGMSRQEQVDNSIKGRRSSQNKDPERFYTNLYYKNTGDHAQSLKDGRDDEKQITTPLDWVAYKQQFFCAIMMSENGFRNAQQLTVNTNRNNQEDKYLCDMSSVLGLDYDATSEDYTLDMGFYYGPTKYRILRDMGRGFDRLLPLGWGFFLTQWVCRFAIIPVFNFLEGFGWNYGIIIIVLTILLKVVLSPLTHKSYKSSAVMRILRPEISELNKKFPKQEQAMQKQQAMQQLYKRAGISPLAGCLPMLIQMPILFAMYRFYPASIELRQQPFLWCDDLSTYDSIVNLPFNIPLYGDHISLFCLLMFGMQFFYTVYTMKQQQDQAAMPGMKFMMYFTPFMMLFIFNSQSAALNIYYFFNLVLSVAQMWSIRAFTSEKKIRQHMAAYDARSKGKVQKKSKFQQRLEEMQKMQEQMQKQQRR